MFEESRDALYIDTLAGRSLDIKAAGVRLFEYDSKKETVSLGIATDLYWNPENRKRTQAGFLSEVSAMSSSSGPGLARGYA